MHQLAVIDRPAPEGRFRHVCLTAKVGNLGQNRVVLHEFALGRWGWAATEFPPFLSLLPNNTKPGGGLRAVNPALPTDHQSGEYLFPVIAAQSRFIRCTAPF